MIIVAGHLTVDPAARDDYLRGCEQVVRLARAAPGCLDFAIDPDLLEAERINVHERWASRCGLEAFRGSGPPSGQQDVLIDVAVDEHEVADAST